MGVGIRLFLSGISLKANVIERLEFALFYFKAAVQHFGHYVLGLFTVISHIA